MNFFLKYFATLVNDSYRVIILIYVIYIRVWNKCRATLINFWATFLIKEGDA